jgi:hypothetical protein
MIVLNRIKRKTMRWLLLPTLTPVNDDEDEEDEPFRPTVSPFVELINDVCEEE